MAHSPFDRSEYSGVAAAEAALLAGEVRVEVGHAGRAGLAATRTLEDVLEGPALAENQARDLGERHARALASGHQARAAQGLGHAEVEGNRQGNRGRHGPKIILKVKFNFKFKFWDGWARLGG